MGIRGIITIAASQIPTRVTLIGFIPIYPCANWKNFPTTKTLIGLKF